MMKRLITSRAHNLLISLGKINQICRSARTLREALQNTLEQVAVQPECEQAVIYQYKRKENLLEPIVFPAPIPVPLRPVDLLDLPSEMAELLVTNRTVLMLPSTISDFFDCTLGGSNFKTLKVVAIPLWDHRTFFGLCLLWIKGQPAQKAITTIYLTFVKNLLETVISDFKRIIDSRTMRFLKSFQKRSEAIVSCRAPLSSIVNKLFNLIRSWFPETLVSLAVFDARGFVSERFTLGITGKILQERGMNSSLKSGVSHQVWCSGKPILREGISDCVESEEEKLFRAGGVQSYLATPLMVQKKVVATLILGIKQSGWKPGLLSQSQQFLSELFSRVLAQERAYQLDQRHQRLLSSMSQHAQAALHINSTTELLNYTSKLLVHELPATLCRIWMLEHSSGHLMTKTFSALRPLDTALNPLRRLSLTELPWHRLAVEEGKIMRIDQEDPESVMSTSELKKTFTQGVQSGLIVPVQDNGTTVGILSVAEMRNKTRHFFSEADEVFIAGIAYQLVPALLRLAAPSGYLLADHNQGPEVAERLNIPPYARFHDEMINPITTILGAIEILRVRRPETPEKIGKYLDTIERSAQRLHETLHAFSEGLNEPARVQRNVSQTAMRY